MNTKTIIITCLVISMIYSFTDNKVIIEETKALTDTFTENFTSLTYRDATLF